MTSKSSFFKLMKEDLRQRLWTIILAMVVFLLPLPIVIGMEISTRKDWETLSIKALNGLQRDLMESLGTQCWWLVVVVIVGAMICAVSGFGYLFSKRKVDFFHSLPVKRETQFAVRYVNGVLIFLVPYLLMLIVCLVIIGCSGYMRTEIFASAMEGLLVHFLGYLIVYTTFILCTMFVGNTVVFFAVSGWTFGIVFMFLLLYNGFETNFFNTYSYYSQSIFEWLDKVWFLSPGYVYLQPVFEDAFTMGELIKQIAYVVVLAVITLFVYRARRSEGAGKAIAFSGLKPVLRCSIELLAGGCVGLLFYLMADSGNGMPGWMIFGAILGVVLSHMLIESIFHYDVRKCFAHKRALVASAAITVGFVLMMRYDVLGYDSYLPKEKKLESVAVEIRGFDGYRSIYSFTQNTYLEEIMEMELTDIETVYPYLEALVEDTEKFYEGESTDLRYGEDFAYQNTGSVHVAYRLKNGRTVYREYISYGLHEELFAPIFESEEYKTCHYGDVYTLSAEMIQRVVAQDAMDLQYMTLSAQEKEELVHLLCMELSAMSLAEKLNNYPVALLQLEIGKPSLSATLEGDSESKVVYDYDVYEYGYVHKCTVPVYASYTETLRFLRERGFDPEKPYEWTGEERMTVYIAEHILKDISGVSEQKIYAAYSEGGEIHVKPEDFAQLYELCIWSEYLDYGNPIDGNYNYSDNYSGEVYVSIPRDGYNNYDGYRFRLKHDADLSFLFD